MVAGSEKRFFQSKIFVPIVLAVFFLALFAYGRVYYRDYQIREEIAKMEEEAKKLQAKKLESLHFLDFVKSDAYAEEQARLNLNLAKPGEQVAVVAGVEKFNTAVGQITEKVIQSNEVPNFVQWWYYFMGDDGN